MIREALDDAGLTIADVDGICSAGMGDGPRRVPRRAPDVDRLDDDRRAASRSTSSTRRRPSRSARPGRGGRVYATRPAPTGRPPVELPGAAGEGGRADRHVPGGVGGTVRAPHADRRVRARRQPAHARVRHDARAARPDRGVDARVGVEEPPRPLPGPAHDRRRALRRRWCAHRCTSSTAACRPTAPARS